MTKFYWKYYFTVWIEFGSETCIVPDSEHDGYDQNDQTMTLQVLTNRRYRTLTNFSCSYSHIFSYPHKNDYQCSSVDVCNYDI